MNPCFASLLGFLSEWPVFLWEHSKKNYHEFPYFISKTIVELPFTLFIPLLYSSIVYFFTGFQPGFDKFCFFTMVLLLGVGMGSSLGFFFGCLFEDMNSALFLTNVVCALPMAFNGIIANLTMIGWYIWWMAYLSPYWYMCEALMRSEYDNEPEILEE